MEYHFEQWKDEDRVAVIDIFNYYVDNSFAAYPSIRLRYEAFDFLTSMIGGYPAISVKNNADELIGFGFIRPYNPADTMRRTAEVTYFLAHEYTGKAIGAAILDFLTSEAIKMGIDNFLASISSRNEESIKFHLKHGFIECGRFRNVGRKSGEDFDVVWMQKFL